MSEKLGSAHNNAVNDESSLSGDIFYKSLIVLFSIYNEPDQPSKDPLELCAVQQIDKDNSASVTTKATTTPGCDQHGARRNEEPFSGKEPASSRNHENNLEGLKLGSLASVPTSENYSNVDAAI